MRRKAPAYLIGKLTEVPRPARRKFDRISHRL
jgi:hypothetical protein